jgi:hypothetical protein
MMDCKLMTAQPSGATTKNTKVTRKNATNATVRLPFKEREGSVFTAMTANQTLEAAKKLPNPRKLWKEYWYENEVCCLFADTNVGKSVLAVQIANEIAKTDTVLYYDFELGEKQFQLRYTDPQTQQTYKFPKGLIRLTLSTEKLMAMGDKMEDIIMASIEGDVKGYGAKIVIVDNISWLVNSTNSTKIASNLVKRLVALKKMYGLSILVLAHNRKRSPTKPITQNDLSGSKQLINFFDSAFVIGKSAAEAGLMYVKQVKVRTGKEVYGEHHVMLCTIEQKSRFLQFVEQGCGDEADHLKRPKASDISLKRAKVMELRAKGMSVREIAEASGIPKSTVGRLINA